MLKPFPFWDPLRDDPRFEQIVVSLAPKDNVRRSGTCGTVATRTATTLPDLIFRDQAEETGLFVGDSSSEINSGTERKKIPQTIKLNWVAIGPTNRFQKSASRRIVVIDRPVAKIADPEFTIDQGESPRCVEIAI